MKKDCVGKWRIQAMEAWDKDFIDLVVPGHFTINKDGPGSFQFGAVEGDMDCRVESIGDIERLEFSWQGQDEGDPVSGRGWALVEGKKMKAKIYFHLGDESTFKATKEGK